MILFIVFFLCNAPSRVGYILNSYCVAVYGSILMSLSEPLDSSYFRH